MGVITGFTDLDYILNRGLQKGCLYVLAGRPSMGKTGMAINMVDHICFKQHRTVVYFSLEMSCRELTERVLALEAEIDPYKLRSGRIDDDDWFRIARVAETMGNSGLIVNDTPAIDIKEIREKCLDYRKDANDIAVIFIDYLQLISGSDNDESREKEMSEIVKDLKALARELDRPIVVLSQISRAPEHRKNHRPILSDFYTSDSGSVIQYADVIMFLYREGYYNMDFENKVITEVIVAKNPMGPVGTIELGFEPSFVKFENRRIQF